MTARSSPSAARAHARRKRRCCCKRPASAMSPTWPGGCCAGAPSRCRSKTAPIERDAVRGYWAAISTSGVRMVRLHGFCQSGNTFKVAFFLRALGAPWEAVHVDYMHGITRDPKWRETANEMGEVPMLEDGARRLTPSGLILTH